jgi:hypothetical protein
VALESYSAAVTQYNANLAYWESESKAKLLLEAVLYLEGNRPTTSADSGTTTTFSPQTLASLRQQLTKHLGLDGDGAEDRARFVRGRCV